MVTAAVVGGTIAASTAAAAAATAVPVATTAGLLGTSAALGFGATALTATPVITAGLVTGAGGALTAAGGLVPTAVAGAGLGTLGTASGGLAAGVGTTALGAGAGLPTAVTASVPSAILAPVAASGGSAPVIAGFGGTGASLMSEVAAGGTQVLGQSFSLGTAGLNAAEFGQAASGLAELAPSTASGGFLQGGGLTAEQVGTALSAVGTMGSAGMDAGGEQQPTPPPPPMMNIGNTTPAPRYESPWPGQVNIQQQQLMAMYLSGTL